MRHRVAAPAAGPTPGGGRAGGPAGPQQRRRPGSDLSSARLLRPAKRPPQSGWRRVLYLLSGRLINPGESPADLHRRELTVRVNQPLRGCYKIAMLSLKGGVGKTTITATLGATFASLRGDRVVAVDANPDRGTLSQKIPLETSATVRHLLRDAGRLRRYTDVRAYTSQGPSRLEVLASEQDPAVSEAFSEDDYRRTVNLLEHFYNIVLTDCGTGLMHSAMYGVLGVADQLIIVSSGSIDGARSAVGDHGLAGRARARRAGPNSVAVINCVHRSAGGVDLDRVAAHFAARCRAVVQIPFDAHLEEGAEVELDRLEPSTQVALLELAAAVADAFDASGARLSRLTTRPAPRQAVGGGSSRRRTLSSSWRRNSGSSSGPLTGGGVGRAGRPPRRAAAALGSGRGVHRLPQHQSDDRGADECDEEQHRQPPPPRG